MTDNDRLPSAPEHKAAVNEAYALRGTIVGSYAHIEFLLADFCVRAWDLPEYFHLRGAFPHKVKTRILKFRELFLSGVLAEYRSEAEDLTGSFQQYEENRHFMAHGLMMIGAHPSGLYIVEIRLYKATKEGAQIGILTWPLEGMRGEADEIAAYCSKWPRFFHKLHDRLGWVGTNDRSSDE